MGDEFNNSKTISKNKNIHLHKSTSVLTSKVDQSESVLLVVLVYLDVNKTAQLWIKILFQQVNLLELNETTRQMKTPQDRRQEFVVVVVFRWIVFFSSGLVSSLGQYIIIIILSAEAPAPCS